MKIVKKTITVLSGLLLLSACNSNPPVSQAERDYRFQRAMQVMQQWHGNQPPAPAFQPSGIQHCRHYYVGTTLRTECM